MDVLDLFDDAAKAAAFESYWTRLQNSRGGTTDLETLRVCIRLLPPAAKVSSRTIDGILHGIGVEADTTGKSKGKWHFWPCH